MDTNTALLLAVIIVLAGLAGLILPAIPGAPLIFAGLLVAAWAEGFAYVGFWTLLVLALLALLTLGVDLWATMFGAKKFGASKRAIIGALIGSVSLQSLGIAGVFMKPVDVAIVIQTLNTRLVLKAPEGAKDNGHA